MRLTRSRRKAGKVKIRREIKQKTGKGNANGGTEGEGMKYKLQVRGMTDRSDRLCQVRGMRGEKSVEKVYKGEEER